MPPALLVLTDTERFPDPARTLGPLLELLPAKSAGIIVRDRSLSESEWLKLAESMRELTDRTQQRLILGSHIEHAERLGAFGVHLPSDGPSPRRARDETGALWVSRSGHDFFDLAPSEQSALDAILVSPVFAARKGRPAIGLARLAEVARSVSPVLAYALGGVGSEEVASCLRAGASGVAIIEAAHIEAPAKIARALAAARTDVSSTS